MKRTPLGRGTGLQRRASSTPVVKTRRDTGPSASVKALVDGRCGGDPAAGFPGRCEWPGCSALRLHRHHRLNRKDGGRHGLADEVINGAEWLLGACWDHHMYVTSASGTRLRIGREMGWILQEEHLDRVLAYLRLPEHLRVRPAYELLPKVLTRHADIEVYLCDDGTWRPA